MASSTRLRSGAAPLARRHRGTGRSSRARAAAGGGGRTQAAAAASASTSTAPAEAAGAAREVAGQVAGEAAGRKPATPSIWAAPPPTAPTPSTIWAAPPPTEDGGAVGSEGGGAGGGAAASSAGEGSSAGEAHAGGAGGAGGEGGEGGGGSAGGGGGAAGEAYEGGARAAWHAKLRAAFLVGVGEDAFELVEIARRLQPGSPLTALSSAGLEMLGPLRMLAGGGAAAGGAAGGAAGDAAAVLAGRDVHHPAEYLPLLSLGLGSEPRLGLGYWSDEPQAEARLLVLCKPLPKGHGPGVGFSVVADNLLAATHSLLMQEAKKGGLRAGAAKRAAAEIGQAAAAAGCSLEAQGDRSEAARARKKRVVAPLSNKMGVVVPYDKATELGYRQLHCTGAALRKLLSQIEGSSGEERVAKQAELDDLVNWATIANDESDFGASLQLGQDLFNHSPSFAPLAGRILSTAYTLLGRDAFARIAVLHAKHRAA